VDVQRTQWMILRNDRFHHFRQTRRGDRARNELDAHRLKYLRRQGLARIAGPERMPVAGGDRETGDAFFAHETEDLVVFDRVPRVQHRVAVARPVFAPVFGCET